MNQIHDTYIHFSEERALIIMATFIKTHFLWADTQARISLVQTLLRFPLGLAVHTLNLKRRAPSQNCWSMVTDFST
jgi:hypothetical protein